MPNATSVGLAKAFADEKQKFQGTIKWWNAGFILSIVALVGFSAFKLFYFETDISDLQNTLSFTVSGLPIILPLVWLTGYCAKRRSESTMLLQEYTHKETFANSYSSYKDQIEKLKGKEKDKLLNELLEKSITIISRNPTKVLDKKHSSDLPTEELKRNVGDKIPQKTIKDQ